MGPRANRERSYKRELQFVDINAMALNAAINGSIFAPSDACLAMRMAFPIGSTPALVTAETSVYDLGGA